MKKKKVASLLANQEKDPQSAVGVQQSLRSRLQWMA